MGYFKELAILVEDIGARIELEIQKGFDSLDEMKEVFKEIAEDFEVEEATVWEVFHTSDYDMDYDPGDLDIDVEF